MKRSALIIIILCFTMSAFSQWQSYPFSPPGSVLSFPIDDGKHLALNTNTEWWYINLHLVGSAPAFKKYDIMLCYFSKPANMRIFNIADPGTGIFHTDVNQTPFAFSQLTGHWELTYTIPFSINDYSKWTFPTNNKTFSYVFHAESPNNNDGLDITVTSNRTPLIVGGNGFMPIGGAGDSSFYYSLSNMKVEGTIKYGGAVDNISSGIGWIDRQWGPFTVGINSSNMYEWFSLQVDKPGTTLGIPQTPSEFNIWQIFSDSTNVPYNRAYRLVSGIYPDDSQDTISSFIFERTGYWYDPVNHKYYSQGWRLINPAKGINIDMVPAIQNQVINVTLFKFWEGSTLLKGTVGNQPVDGLGFAELVAARNTPIVNPSVPGNLIITPFSNYYSLNWSASTQGTYPIGGYRVFRSATNDGHWRYVATTTGLSYNDYSAPADTGYFYTITSFDNQTHTSASVYASPVWVDPLIIGVHDISRSNRSIQIYPNPANDKIFIELPDFKNTSIAINRIDGQLMQKISLQAEKTKIDISNLSKGIYFIQVTNGRETVVRKLIKQ